MTTHNLHLDTSCAEKACGDRVTGNPKAEGTNLLKLEERQRQLATPLKQYSQKVQTLLGWL